MNDIVINLLNVIKQQIWNCVPREDVLGGRFEKWAPRSLHFWDFVLSRWTFIIFFSLLSLGLVNTPLFGNHKELKTLRIRKNQFLQMLEIFPLSEARKKPLNNFNNQSLCLYLNTSDNRAQFFSEGVVLIFLFLHNVWVKHLFHIGHFSFLSKSSTYILYLLLLLFLISLIYKLYKEISSLSYYVANIFYNLLIFWYCFCHLHNSILYGTKL